MRITVSTLDVNDIDALAGAVTSAVQAVGRASV
jgi:hypothetical protein